MHNRVHYHTSEFDDGLARSPENDNLVYTAPQDVDLPLDTTSTGPAQSVPFLDAILEVEHALDDVGFKFVTELLVLLVGDVGQRNSLLFCERYSSAGNVMGLSERHLWCDAQKGF
jgi:hypothetical protein